MILSMKKIWSKMADEILHNAAAMTRIAITITAIKTFVCDLTLCVGPSMIPTFNEFGDVVLVNRALKALTNTKSQRGDIVLATSPTNPNQLVIKRVVGVGGDLIKVPFSSGRNFKFKTREVDVPLGSVWLQGDNQMNSTDSRDYGPVPEDMILGRAMVRIWPPNAIAPKET